MRTIGRGSRILVTGGAGFVGAALVRRLGEEGLVVRVLDDLSSGRRERLGAGEAELVVGDVRSERSVREAVTDMDAVVHVAAALPDGSPRSERLAHDVNVTGTLNLLAACAREKVARFVFASSAAVYGSRVPYLLHEDMAPHPASSEGAQKAAAEGYVRLFGERDNLTTVILRLFSVYGPDRQAGVIADFMAAARAGGPLTIFGDGSQTRDLLHVEDAVTALGLALHTPGAAGRTFNVASGEAIGIRHIATMVSDLAGGLPPPRYAAGRPGEARDVRASVAAAAAGLGFRARVRLREGLAACLGLVAPPARVPIVQPRRFPEGSESKLNAIPARRATTPPPIPAAVRAHRSTPLFADRPPSFLVDEDDVTFDLDEDTDALLPAARSSEAWA